MKDLDRERRDVNHGDLALYTTFSIIEVMLPMSTIASTLLLRFRGGDQYYPSQVSISIASTSRLDL